MDSRARRIGENEVLFREVNSQMRSLDEKLSAVTTGETYDFVCECGSVGCDQRIALTIADYERIHADPAQFVVVPGHEEPSVEDVVEHDEGYAVVRKKEGGPAELAAEHAEG
jgi:hypothetical protein